MKCCDLSAGKLNKKISLQRITRTPDGGGGYTESWTEYAKTWAHVKPKTGNEIFSGMQLEANITHDIMIRYRSDILPNDKIVLETSRELNIRSIIDLEERHVWLQLRCEEGVAV